MLAFILIFLSCFPKCRPFHIFCLSSQAQMQAIIWTQRCPMTAFPDSTSYEPEWLTQRCGVTQNQGINSNMKVYVYK